MIKQGSYYVNKSASKDSSFKSFIFALLVFLSLCIAIYLILVLSKNSAKEDNLKDLKNSEKSKNNAFLGPNDALFRAKEYSTTVGWLITAADISKAKTLRDPSTKLPVRGLPSTEPSIFLNASSTNGLRHVEKGMEISTDVSQSTSNTVGSNEHFSNNYQSSNEITRENDNLFIKSEDESLSTTELTTEAYKSISEITETDSARDTTYNFPPTHVFNSNKNPKDSEEISTNENFYSTTKSFITMLQLNEAETIRRFTDNFKSSSESNLFESRTISVSDITNFDLTTNAITPITSSNKESITIKNSKPLSTTEAVKENKGIIRTFTDNFQSSTEINLLGTISVSDVADIDFTTNSAKTVISSRNESVTLASSVPFSTKDVANENTRTTFTNNFQSSTEMNLLETVSVSDIMNLDLTTNPATSKISTREKNITIESSTPLSTTEATKEDKATRRTYTDNFQSSTEINLFRIVSVIDAVNNDSTTNSAETVTLSVIKENSVPLSTIQSYIETTGKMGVTSLEHIPVTVCSTAICKRITSKILNLMDHAADPCEDFYKFACGEQQSDDNVIFKQLNFEALVNYLTEVDKMYLHNFKFFYESCVNYEQDFKFAKRLDLLNYHPYNNLTELFIELILTQAMPLFDVGLDIVKDTSRYALHITLPGRSSLRASVGGWSVMEQIRKHCLNEQNHLIRKSKINLSDIYTSLKDCQKNRFKNSTKSFVENMQWHIQNDNNYSIYNHNNSEKLLGLLDDIQILLPSELEIEAQEEKDYKRFKIDDLNKNYNAVDWKSILDSLTFDGMFVENNIEVYFPDYIEKMLNKLKNYNERELMELLALYSKLQLYENIVISKYKENREIYCMDLSNQIMPDVALIIVYEMARSNGKFDRQNQTMNILFDRLKSQFNESLEKLKSEPSSIEILQKKLNKIELGLITNIDYNSTIDNYKEIIISTNNFQKNVMSLLSNYRKIIYSLKGKEVSAGSLLTYFVDPFYTRPKTFYKSKYIVFHPTIFQRTSVDLPDYIILSKIGLHLSLELAKHFDPIGIQNMSSQIYDDLKKQTNDLLLLFANNNNTYDLEGKFLHFQINNSILWTTKMIADNAAFRLVVDTYNFHKSQLLDLDLPWIYKSYPAEKVFFIAAAQEYCEKTTALNFMEDIYQTGQLPPPLKIKNMISNSKKFSETFECADGSVMKLSEGQMTYPFPYYNPIDYNSEYSEFTLSN